MEIAKITDYEQSYALDVKSGTKTAIDLPKSNVISYDLTDGSSLIVRPSGTEPKIKLYLSAVGKGSDGAAIKLAELEKAGTALLGF